MDNEYGQDKNGVRELTVNDFDLEGGSCLTNDDRSGAIVFYQAWCPHCRDIVDDVVEANNKLNDRHIIFAVHGQTEGNGEVFNRFGVSGIPSIKFIEFVIPITKNMRIKILI